MAQKFLALDLSVNLPSRKIIQVGIAIGSRDQAEKDYCIKQWLVNPEEPIAPTITALTGITRDTIAAAAVSWPTVAAELKAMLGRHQPIPVPITWTPTNCQVLCDSFRNRSLEFKGFGAVAIDVGKMHGQATVANKTAGLAENVATALRCHGLQFSGNTQSAALTAANTLRLFFALEAKSLTTVKGVSKPVAPVVHRVRTPWD